MEKNRIRPVKVGNGVRMSYAKQQEVLEMPNLIELQTNSYQWFLDEGLKEVFRDISPISDFGGHLSLEFVDFVLCRDETKYDIDQCKERDATYAAPLKVKVRLHNKETEEIKEHEIFMGDLPLMTATCTFVINGAERVIVSQLVRSPGIYYAIGHDKFGKELYSSTVIPNRGAWLDSFFDIFQNVELPLITKINISISKFLQDYWYFVLLVAAGLVVTFIALLRVEKVRFQVDKLKIKIPKFGKLLMTIYTSRFARTLCSLYTSGMSIVNALNIAKTTIGNVYIESQFDGAIKKLRNGESLSQAIKDIDGFDIKLTSSIFVGEESGRLESTLTTLADDFDFEAEQASERMITLIQPLMIIFLAVVICLIIISVLLPIYTLYNNVGNM